MFSPNEELNELINDCLNLIENINTLDTEVIIELYDFQKKLIDIINKDIIKYGTSARTLLCKNQDIVLNKIVEFYEDYNIEELNNIYTPAIQGFRHWKNVELLKDKGLVGYFLSKTINAKPIMMFCSNEIDYSSNNLLENQELIYSSNDMPLNKQYELYLKNNYMKMDVLILHGMYNETIIFLDLYRKLRPDGIVFCGLDMNSNWLNRINWDSEIVRHFTSQCNIIATSSIKIRDILNDKTEVSFPCYYLPNGFAHLGELTVCAKASIKKNIILTVGRIGIAEKNNLELLIGFALVANEMPDWSLRLVGPIEKDFEPKIKEFFEKCPDLVDRVIFTGPIYDKQLLYNEYAHAKCFALTSILEGAPNVYAEAIYHGCKIIVSSIDTAEEMINYGELGYMYNIGDYEALAKCFLKLRDSSSLEDFEIHIEKTLDYAKRNYDWVKNAKKLAIMFKRLNSKY